MGPADHAAAASRVDVFADRARGWEERFADDAPRYAWAATLLAAGPGDHVLDVGCGTARLAPTLGPAVASDGVVVGVDPSPAMLAEAVALGRTAHACLVAGAAESLPLPDGWADRVLAAGLLPHLADATVALRELRRVTRAAGRLVVFHPVSRATLVGRHVGMATDDHVLAPPRLGASLEAAGWDVEAVHDLPDRFAVVAHRRT